MMKALGRGMFPSAQLGVDSGLSAPGFLDRMSHGEQRVWERHYLSWIHDLTPGDRRRAPRYALVATGAGRSN